ncbi:MAG: ECF-type sigma factor [Phycisphaerales bacterium]
MPDPSGDTGPSARCPDPARSPGAGFESLLAEMYDQLRARAQAELASERPGHTLQATALVNEACLKLMADRLIPWQSRGHLYTAAAQAMRHVLIDHARSRAAEKRGGDRKAVGFEDVSQLADADPEEILRFDGELSRLEVESPEAGAVVRLRFFAGLTVEQTAEALGVSTSSVDRKWAYARAWLYRRLNDKKGEAQ